MKLNPGERSILANFTSAPDAEAALKALQEAGFASAQLDRVSRAGASPDGGGRPPAIRGQESSLTAAVMEPPGLDRESGILLAASPEVSGMSAPVTDNIGPFLLTVVTRKEREPEALAIIQQYGGTA